MRVGRAALDEDAIRLIEQSNPEVEFDWERILKGQAEAKPQLPPAREARFEKGRRKAERRPQPPAPPAVVEPQPAPVVEPVLAALEVPLDLVVAALPPDEPPTAAFARLGSEGLGRLRARYAEVLARISERVSDAAKQDELRAQAERLNPDTWVTDSDVAAGLEGYEPTWEALRSVVGSGSRRRRRKRRRGGGAASPAPSGQSPESAADPQDDSGEEGEPDGGEDL